MYFFRRSIDCSGALFNAWPHYEGRDTCPPEDIFMIQHFFKFISKLLNMSADEVTLIDFILQIPVLRKCLICDYNLSPHIILISLHRHLFS